MRSWTSTDFLQLPCFDYLSTSLSVMRDDPCLVFALTREQRSLGRHFAKGAILSHDRKLQRWVSPAGRSVLTLLTGVGRERMRAALGWLLAGPRLGDLVYRPCCIISTGFSGALVDGLRVGDLVLGTEAVAETGGRWPIGELSTWPDHIACRRGRLLTVDRLVALPEEKRKLAEVHGALAVDMESAVVADMCRQHGVPFCCLRAISDDVQTPLAPHLDRIIVDGRVSPWGIVKAVVRSPAVIGALWRLGQHTTLAAERLAEALAALEVLGRKSLCE